MWEEMHLGGAAAACSGAHTMHSVEQQQHSGKQRRTRFSADARRGVQGIEPRHPKACTKMHTMSASCRQQQNDKGSTRRESGTR